MSKIGARAAHFLQQKPWTPWNPYVAKTIWEAEQKDKEAKSREAERAELIKKQGDLEAQSRLVASLGGDTLAIGATAGARAGRRVCRCDDTPPRSAHTRITPHAPLRPRAPLLTLQRTRCISCTLRRPAWGRSRSRPSSPPRRTPR